MLPMHRISPHRAGPLCEFSNALLKPPSDYFGRRVHQYTLHGYTYPFVAAYMQAALPDPMPKELLPGKRDRSRRHSMLGGLLLAQPNDFLFFFQSDPQDPAAKTRRGIRGVFEVAGAPGSATGDPLPHPIHGDRYKLHARCPTCDVPFANLKDSCPNCGAPYPKSPFGRRGKVRLPEHVLSLRVPVRAYRVFEREVSDERVYADLSYEELVWRTLVWIGRHDNQMGAGKGSSIRQLLPEEAIRVFGQLLTENPQREIPIEGVQSAPPLRPILNPDGSPLRCLMWKRGQNEVAEEISLHTAMSLLVNDPSSWLYELLEASVPGLRGLWDNFYLEYASSEFPWGYTGSTSDYVLVFRPRTGAPKRHVVVFEFKMGGLDTSNVAQAWVYMPWIGQLFGMHLGSLGEGEAVVHLTPILIGSGLARDRRGHEKIRCLPESYTRKVRYYNGAAVVHHVNEPLLWKYVAVPGDGCPDGRSSVQFHLLQPAIRRVSYVPTVGTSTSQAERSIATRNLDSSCQDTPI